MKILLEKALSLCLTGSTKTDSVTKTGLNNCPYSKDELAELEIDFEESKKSFLFKNPVLNLSADWESFPGYVRNAGLSAFDSFFSGIGGGLASKTDFSKGLCFAGSSLLASVFSSVKKVPFLSTNFSLFNFGGRLIRSGLHFFDATFSSIGEKGAGLNLPSVIAGLAGLASFQRVIKEKDNKKLELSINTIGGTLGRTAVHHIESMLSSKAIQAYDLFPLLSTFFAGSVTTAGFSSSLKIKESQLPWKTLEGMFSQSSFHFLDSMFSNIGSGISNFFDTPWKTIFGSAGIAAAIPLIHSKKLWDYKVPYPLVEGRLTRALFHTVDAAIFNLGSKTGNSMFGVPLTAGFCGLTYLTALSKNKLLKNIKVPMNTIGGLIQRLPFDFIYSMISACGSKISSFLPAPLLFAIGPALCFRIGEIFKNQDAKYDELTGLMIRNSVHFLETIFAGAAYKTGRMITGTADETALSGSLLADGRWLTDEGRIVPSMAIGKQGKSKSKKNIFKILFSAVCGILTGVVISEAGKKFYSTVKNTTTTQKINITSKETNEKDTLTSSDIESNIHHLSKTEGRENTWQLNLKVL